MFRSRQASSRDAAWSGELAPALKATGARLVLIQHAPDDEAPFRSRGVDGFLRTGTDLLVTLTDTLRALGVVS